MTALAKDRNTPQIAGERFTYPVKGGEWIHAGALVFLDSGVVVPGSETASLVFPCRAENSADNRNGGDGDLNISVTRGAFGFANDGAVTAAHVGTAAYAADDQTVSADDNAGARPRAGIIVRVENQVFVDVRL